MLKDSEPYKILVMEDNAGDFAIVEDLLTEQFLDPDVRHAKSFRQGASMLKLPEKPFDAILLDLHLPDKDGQVLINEMLRLAKDCPIIVLTGYSDINFSKKSISEGVLDYLLKDEMNATILYKSIIYSIERKKNITEKNHYHRNLIQAITKTQEDERYEIGGELHDNVCQILAASKITLETLEKSLAVSAKPQYDQCKQLINLAFVEIRNLSHRLAPAFFDDSTLEESFTKLFETFDATRTIDYVLHFDKDVASFSICPEIQLNLYRILQEQLRNIFKYAKAKKIEVFVDITDNILKMQICDDGVGFDMDEIRGGIGLSNMKRRAELFGGSYRLNTSPGEGCNITITIPLPALETESKSECVINSPHS